MWTKKESGLIMSIFFGLAAEESMQISEKAKLGTETLVRNGGIPYRVPFGAKNVKDR